MIHVYVGKGVDGGGLRQLMRSLQLETASPLERLDALELLHSSWERSSSLLIVPGGRDCFYHSDLDGRGTDKIRAFVEAGGGYLGICAGAYFASGTIAFERGGPLEVCGERSLRFFPGLAWGPAYGPNQYSYENARGAKSATISTPLGDGGIYFNGGCAFDAPAEDVIGRYLDLPGAPPAILQRQIGKGQVILSGVHLEYQRELLNGDDPYLLPLLPSLHASEPFRRALLRSYLQSFGIPLKKQ